TFERLEQLAGELSGAQVPAPLASQAPSPASGAQISAVVSDAVRKAEPLLLATKLAPPRLPAALVVRERLLEQLDGALMHRLTLLSAAAGWGKTTLLTSWLQSVERRAQSVEQLHDATALRSTFYALRFGWLSLDAL